MTLPLLDSLSPELRTQLRALARRRKFAKNETVFHQGDPGDVLHLVEDGRFAVEVLTPLGHRMVIRLVGPGEHFGELALTSEDSTRNATLIAIEASTTLAIHRRDFEDVRKRSPAVDRLLVAALAERVKVETETAMELAFVPVDVRMYRRLLTLSGMYGPASKLRLRSRWCCRSRRRCSPGSRGRRGPQPIGRFVHWRSRGFWSFGVVLS